MNQIKRLELLQKKRELEAQIISLVKDGKTNDAMVLSREMEDINTELGLMAIMGKW